MIYAEAINFLCDSLFIQYSTRGKRNAFHIQHAFRNQRWLPSIRSSVGCQLFCHQYLLKSGLRVTGGTEPRENVYGRSLRTEVAHLVRTVAFAILRQSLFSSHEYSTLIKNFSVFAWEHLSSISFPVQLNYEWTGFNIQPHSRCESTYKSLSEGRCHNYDILRFNLTANMINYKLNSHDHSYYTKGDFWVIDSQSETTKSKSTHSTVWTTFHCFIPDG